jgi:hypothetical protein
LGEGNLIEVGNCLNRGSLFFDNNLVQAIDRKTLIRAACRDCVAGGPALARLTTVGNRPLNPPRFAALSAVRI